MLKLLLKAVLLVAIPTTALAQTNEWRCNTDSLDPTQALARLEWARKCGLTTNTGGAGSSIVGSKAFDQTFQWARDYVEINTSRAFSGGIQSYNVNYHYASARYETTPLYTVFTETSGPTNGYLKWSNTTERPRPLYPTFQSQAGFGAGLQLIPRDSTSCLFNQKDATTGVLTPYTGTVFYMAAHCVSSCYTPDQNLLFSEGEVNIVEALKANRNDLITLAPDATLDNLTTQTSSVYSYISELRDSEHLIYELNTASGGKLRVTNEHPVITSEGRLVTADKLSVGDELVRADGSPDRIVSVMRSTHFGKVYNIKPTSTNQVSNILIAQGFLVGSSRFQNEDVKYMNRILLFPGIPEDKLPR
jgi:hypothetical protein